MSESEHAKSAERYQEAFDIHSATIISPDPIHRAGDKPDENTMVGLLVMLAHNYTYSNQLSRAKENLREAERRFNLVAVARKKEGQRGLFLQKLFPRKLCHTGLKLLLSELYSAFGFDPSTRPVSVAFVLRDYVTAPLGILYHFGSLALSRRHEYAADRFSAELGYADAMARTVVKLGKNNLGMPIDDWLYAMFSHSHPSGLERVEALRKHL